MNFIVNFAGILSLDDDFAEIGHQMEPLPIAGWHRSSQFSAQARRGIVVALRFVEPVRGCVSGSQKQGRKKCRGDDCQQDIRWHTEPFPELWPGPQSE
jgi:hypothetical protein